MAAVTRRPDDDGGSVRASGAGGAPAVGGGVKYRNAMYRSSSPSRKVGRDLVVHSNLMRAPRFKEVKSDVPGE